MTVISAAHRFPVAPGPPADASARTVAPPRLARRPWLRLPWWWPTRLRSLLAQMHRDMDDLRANLKVCIGPGGTAGGCYA